MPESLRTRVARHRLNLFPAFRGCGGRVTYVADDWREVRVALPLGWRTRNYVGTIYGGSMYGVVDPIYMVMLIHVMGPGYVVWDKAGSIRFRKPGRSTLHARFRLEDGEVEAIRAATAGGQPVDRTYRIELVDREGTVHAEVEKVIHVRRRRPEDRAG